MTILNSLNISNVRKIKSAQFYPDKTVNVIEGDNGSGKTSLLESIYISAIGRSFRSANIKTVISQGEDFLRTVASVSKNVESKHSLIGVEKTQKKTLVKIDSELCPTASRLSKLLPIILINPDSHKILEEGPRHRRNLIDHGVFHVEQNFQTEWSRFLINLKQRNVSLRQRSNKRVVTAWDPELVDSVEKLNMYRERYIDDLQQSVNIIKKWDNLPILEKLEISLKRGWDEDMTYAQSLEKHWGTDLKQQFTQMGPHRADLEIMKDNRPIKGVISRGQQKFLAAILQIAQAITMKRRTGIYPVFLIDDLTAELDKNMRAILCALIEYLQVQAIVTVIDASQLNFTRAKYFNIEEGTLIQKN